ncbi:hypothetical protein, partial [Streptomyces sp. SID337]
RTRTRTRTRTRLKRHRAVAGRYLSGRNAVPGPTNARFPRPGGRRAAVNRQTGEPPEQHVTYDNPSASGHPGLGAAAQTG